MTFVLAILFFVTAIVCCVRGFMDDDVYESNMGWWLLGALAAIIAAFVFFIVGITHEINDYNRSITADCNQRNGEILQTGKYGDNVCIVDGKITKVYK